MRSMLWAITVAWLVSCSGAAGAYANTPGSQVPLGSELVRGLRANPNHIVTLTLGLHQCNVAKLASVVGSVSSPRSASYGKHLTVQEVSALLRCPQSATRQSPLQQVRSWLTHQLGPDAQGATLEARPSGDWARLSLRVAAVERLFQVTMFHFHSREPHAAQPPTPTRRSAKSLVLADDGSTPVQVPPAIANAVDVILGISAAAKPYRKRVYPRPSSAHVGDGMTTTEGSASNAPQLNGVLASDTTMYLQFTPVCSDGSPAAGDMCATTAPPAISSFTLTQSVGGKVVASPTCDCGSGAGEGGSSLQAVANCQSQVPTPGAFMLVNVSLVTNYADGTVSSAASGGDAIVTTPFVDAALSSIFYGIPAPPSAGAAFSKWNQSVAEFSHNFFSFNELNEYFEYNKLNPDVAVGVHGPNDGSDPEGEADQDIQWIMGVGQRVDTVFWSTADKSKFILSWLEEVASTPGAVVPRVFSVSYGNPEGLTNEQLGAGYIQRSEVEFMKLAARGISITVADGDSGASSALGCDKLWPEWPASSAYVTSCGGATISSYDIPSTAVAVGSRTGVAYTTGGGFSDVFAQPSYQAAAVATYLATAPASTLPPASMFNASGRAFPDVATLGYNMLSFYANQNWINPFPGGGTSFAAPVMAGMIALLNEERAKAGNPPMGLINHWLYEVAAAQPDAFYDIVVGDNACVMAGVPCCAHGYFCVKGWDAVSGLGSPRFDRLASHVNEPFTPASKR